MQHEILRTRSAVRFDLRRLWRRQSRHFRFRRQKDESLQESPVNLDKDDGKLLIRAEGTLSMVEGAAALHVHLSGDSIALYIAVYRSPPF